MDARSTDGHIGRCGAILKMHADGRYGSYGPWRAKGIGRTVGGMTNIRRTAAASVLLATSSGLLAFAAIPSAVAEEPIIEEETTTTLPEETTTTLPEVTTTTVPEVTTTLAPVVLTDAPSISSVTARPSALSVNWVAQEDLTGGAIRAYQVTAFENGVVKSDRVVAGDVRNASLSGLTNDHDYDVVVMPYTGAGQGNASDSVEATPLRDGSAVAEATMARDVIATTGKRFATVAWAPPANDGGSGITGYSVITVEKVSGAFHSWRNLGADNRSASVPELTSGRAYDIFVMPLTAAGFGDLAPAVSVTTNAFSEVLPLAPATTWVSAVASGGSAWVSWGPAIERGEALTSWNVVVMQGDTMVAWRVIGAAAQRQVAVPISSTGGPASVYVFAQSASGYGPMPTPATVTPPAPVVTP